VPLGRRRGDDLGLIYLQLSLYLAPSHPLALLSLGDLYEAIKKPELANKAYERVLLSSPLHPEAVKNVGAFSSYSREGAEKTGLDSFPPSSPRPCARS
jgi:Tfp pilus assembly protein PilF